MSVGLHLHQKADAILISLNCEILKVYVDYGVFLNKGKFELTCYFLFVVYFFVRIAKTTSMMA